MPALTPDRFAEFYKAVHGYDPFPWQSRVAAKAAAGAWPAVIALPTAAGKTACIDIAVFALACQATQEKRTAARRIFFVVDRRVVVDQAYIHARKLAAALQKQDHPILSEVAAALRAAGAGDRPLDVYALRGGMYREDVWVRTPTQPTVICSTVDQVGSRLLFRGYGVSDSMKPVHAGLVGNDSLILLDEAHCARPFVQTTASVVNYRAWRPALAPFTVVTMSATPDAATPPEQVEGDTEEDRTHAVLGKRINAMKPTTLVVSEKAKGKKGRGELVKTLAEQARALMADGYKAVGVIVNRVATARELRTLLQTPTDKKAKPESLPRVILLTGRMRPLDRDRVTADLEPLFSGKSGDVSPTFVVATQCLECGADLDLHALVTECASLDALRQRFGRLNRVAARDSAKGVVVVRGDQTDDTAEDPVYGASLSNTWKWLNEKAAGGAVNFGVAAMRELTANAALESLNAPTQDAPVLLPAHLDCWVQTSPVPAPDPDPALFLHGPAQAGEPDVQVILRGDLGADESKWAEVVGLCPPSSSEALPVRIGLFRKWLAGETPADESADIEGGTPPEQDEADEVPTSRKALCWAGPEREETEIVGGDNVRPNRTYVIPVTADGLGMLGDFPTMPPTDDAEAAFQRSRDRAVLRFPGLSVDPEADDFDDQLTKAVTSRLTASPPKWLAQAVECLADPKKRTVAPYPDGTPGVVLLSRRRLFQYDPTFSDDESAFAPASRAVTLADHTQGVANFAEDFAAGCGLVSHLPRFIAAAHAHDVGKADPRFQAMLQGRSPRTARPPLLAKSAGGPTTPAEADRAREVHHFPKGARHEMLSVAAAARLTGDPLILHLIATHHGHGRPFAPAMTAGGDAPPAADVTLFGKTYHVDPADMCPQSANATAPERFWQIVRTHGWWGSAYLETVFRLADQAASRAEQGREYVPPTSRGAAVAAMEPPRPRAASHLLALPGLDGSNPLAFLAALGTLNVLHRAGQGDSAPAWLRGGATMSWGFDGANQTPVLHLSSAVSEDEFTETLAALLPVTPDAHSAAFAVRMLAADTPPTVEEIRRAFAGMTEETRGRADWFVALLSEMLPKVASQLQTVRKDYLIGNLVSVMQRTRAEHLGRTLFRAWDYADPLANQSLHWEPTEDRRHAYQWHMPSGDPTRNRLGSMLGANRLAVEAWPLLPSFPAGGRLATRGFRGARADDTFWTWPLWRHPLSPDGAASVLGLPDLPAAEPSAGRLRAAGVAVAFRLQRILVGKTPNFTTARAVAG